MDFRDVTYQGPPIDDPKALADAPVEYRKLLEQVNGIIAFGGGLHIRGACLAPEWHSLRSAWRGPRALHTQFRALHADDVPFAQDAFGDQFVVRDGHVWRLIAESGELERLERTVWEFIEESCRDPREFLALAPLERFRAEGSELHPGELLNVYPPYVMNHEGVRSLRAVPVADRLAFLAHLAAQLADLPDGATVEFGNGE